MRSLLEMVVGKGKVIGEKSALDRRGIPKVKPESQISAFWMRDCLRVPMMSRRCTERDSHDELTRAQLEV